MFIERMERRNRNTAIAALALGAALAIGSAGQSAAAVSSQIKSSLAPTGVDADAEGRIKLSFRQKRSRMRIELQGLEPNSSYSLLVAGQPWASVETNRKGRTKLHFGTPAKGRELALPGDPRGSDLSVHDGASDVLVAVLSGGGESDDTRVREETFLTPTELAFGGRARVRFERRKNGELRFDVELENVTPGAYRVLVGGIERGVLVANSLGRGEIEWRTDSDDGDHLPLDFDPRGEIVDILNDAGEIVFTGSAEAQIPGVSDDGSDDDASDDDGSDDDASDDDGGNPGGPPVACGNPVEIEVPLINAGLYPSGQADARFRLRDGCRTDFQVEIEDVPDGAYELYVGGVPRGTISVSAGQGEIEFDDEPVGAEILIDFDPRGMEVRVESDGVVAFERVFPE
jgi:hypothetical protein